jgi:type I restriction enzyme M protein
MSTPTALVQKLGNHCNILRDDGLSYGDHVEQFTRPPADHPSLITHQITKYVASG